MALARWGFLYTASGADPERDVTVVDTGSCRTILVGMERPEHSVEVARKLVEQHDVQLIELCGGFGPVWASQVLDATGHTIPVGAVAYGPESVDGVHKIFA